MKNVLICLDVQSTVTLEQRRIFKSREIISKKRYLVTPSCQLIRKDSDINVLGQESGLTLNGVWCKNLLKASL